MSPAPPKLGATSMLQRLREVSKAHGSIRHHAQARTVGSYEEIAERVKAELRATPPA